MVSEDVIVKHEVLNDQKSIYVYYSKMFHGFVAYGFSAYLAMKVCKAVGVDLKEDYSDDLQMPIVIIGLTKIDIIKYECVMMQDSIEGAFYHLRCYQIIDEKKYDEWAQWLRDLKYDIMLS